MGAFITNFHVMSHSSNMTTEVMREIAKSGFHVTSMKKGWVSVFDESANQEPKEMKRIASELSARLQTAVVAFLVHDSDIFLYLIYDRGRCVDEYNSTPDYFEEVDEKEMQRTAGEPEVLLRYATEGTMMSQLRDVLDRARFDTFAEERMCRLAALLGVDCRRALMSFGDIESPEEEPCDNELTVMAARDAVIAGDIPRLTALIEAGLDVNADVATQTLLMTAALLGQVEVAQLLIDAGADVNAKDPDGETALLIAREAGHHRLAALLKAAGAIE